MIMNDLSASSTSISMSFLYSKSRHTLQRHIWRESKSGRFGCNSQKNPQSLGIHVFWSRKTKGRWFCQKSCLQSLYTASAENLQAFFSRTPTDLGTESKYFPVVWGPKIHNSNWLLKRWKHWKRSKQTQQLEIRQPHTPHCFGPLFHERLRGHQRSVWNMHSHRTHRLKSKHPTTKRVPIAMTLADSENR